MKQTTIETDSETMSHIKLYCNIKEIKLKDFIVYILNQNEDFIAFVKKYRKLK